jgi:DNA (cytosine-5)-methyltransferase 1
MKHLDLFSGIGGFSLACEWAGIETIGFVEIDKYCQKVLRKHFPNVPIVEDIRDVRRIQEIIANTNSGGLEGTTTEGRDSLNVVREERIGSKAEKIKEIVENPRCKLQSGCEVEAVGSKEIGRRVASINQRPGGTPRDLLQSNTETESPALLITAGFPCQPFSVAGKQRSKEDDRYLWPETLTVIKVVKPKWILLENVTGIINLALDTVLSDLEGAGYSTETLIIPACAVNAWHRRDRVWIVAHAQQPISGRGQLLGDIGDSQWRTTKAQREGIQPTDRQAYPSNIESGSQDVANTTSRESRQSPEPEGREDSGRGSQEVAIANTQREGLEGADTERDLCRAGQSSKYGQGERQADWWAVEPELGRVAHGIPHRVDRLKCLGNAIVPQVAYEIIKMIKELEL